MKIKSFNLSLLAFLLVIPSYSCASKKQSKAKTSKTIKWDFEKTTLDSIPKHWKIEATRSKGALATWKVITDKTAPSGTKVLALTKINHFYPGTFNLCWTNNISFLNGEISLKFKSHTGKEDQGGGIMWRVKDKNNYYVVRFNPLEDNFRLYTVKRGIRRMLATAKVHLKAGKWHSMKIIHRGKRIKAYLNGKKLLDYKTNVFSKAGGVGVWTKSDAVTSFDDFTVTLQK